MWSLHDIEDYREAAQEAGADGFVRKGRLSEDLMAVIERAVQARGCPGEAADVSIM